MGLLNWVGDEISQIGQGARGLLGMNSGPGYNAGLLASPNIQSENLPPFQPQAAQAPAQDDGQASGFFGTLQSNPGLSNALFRLSGALADSASRGENTGVGLGRGFAAFGEGLQQGRQQDFENRLSLSRNNVLVQNLQRQNRLTDAQVKKLERQNQQDATYGINDSTWQGTASLAYATLQNPDASLADKRNAQAVVNVYEAQKGSYNPNTGTFDYNQINRLGPAPLPATGSPSMAPAPTGFAGAIMQAESNGRRYGPDGKLLTSPKGALGEMQVMPATARDPGYGIAPARDNSPEELARVGRDYAAKMQELFPGRPDLAAAAYNGGPGRMQAMLANGQGLAGMPRESRDYSATVVANMGSNPYDNTPATQAAAAKARAQAAVELDTARQKAQIDIGKDVAGTNVKQQQQNAAALPGVLAKSKSMLDTINKALAPDSGLEESTGGFLGMRGRQAETLPITAGQRKFAGIVGQLRGQTFLQAYQDLKGGGQITEIEGTKAENAIARLQQAQEPEDFKAALIDLRDVVNGAMERAKKGVTMTPDQQASDAVAGPKVRRFNPQTGRLE